VSTSYTALQPRRPGRPPACSLEIVMHVIELRRQGLSYADISEELNREGVPTPMGRPVWQRSYVDRLLHTRYVQELWEQCASAPREMASIE
jgi:hypothetical protein